MDLDWLNNFWILVLGGSKMTILASGIKWITQRNTSVWLVGWHLGFVCLLRNCRKTENCII